jgi:hypothetical protein
MIYQLQWLFFIGLLTAEDEGTTVLQNVGRCSSIDTSQPTGPKSSEISYNVYVYCYMRFDDYIAQH